MQAYFDCFSGVSGDMTLGALVDACADLDRIGRIQHRGNFAWIEARNGDAHDTHLPCRIAGTAEAHGKLRGNHRNEREMSVSNVEPELPAPG